MRVVGEPPQLAEPKEHLELGRFDMERARARLRARASATSSATRRSSRSRSTASRSTAPSPHGFTPVLPPVLVREEAMYGTGFFPAEKNEYLRDRRGRPLPDGHVRGRARRPAHGRDPRGGRAAAALHGVLDELPPRGGRGRTRHARDVPRPPVQQGRDVRLHRCRRTRGTSSSGILEHRGVDRAGARPPLPRS